ncbi:MAG: metallophosphoesterase family protein [Dysgonomonas sp.]|nr:metallophosphoesterase family protein [Dysgonomonas sp.]
MKKIVLFTFLFTLTFVVYAQKPGLRFNNDGKFKIVQFTDVHYKKDVKESAVAIELINEVLDAEKPDLVVFTGDVIWAKPVKEGLDEVFAPVISRNIPWTYVFGNHDDEFGMSRQELMDYVVEKPFCLAQSGDKALFGVGNFILEVKDKENKDIETLLYFLDSGAYTPIKGLGTYNWFHPNQVEWFKKESAAYTQSNENTPYPALAFFHIPFAEYPLMTTAKDAKIIGDKKEDECNGKLNTGMFAAMKQSGDVMGTFVGHDHDNDYIGDYYGIYLAYGRYSGGNTVYNNLGKNGCRVIEMEDGKREFTTYLRLLGGETLYPVKYPETFSQK